MSRRVREEVVEDVEWILGTDDPERITHRLGRSPAALARLLVKADRPDLAAPFNQLALQQARDLGYVRLSRRKAA